MAVKKSNNKSSTTATNPIYSSSKKSSFLSDDQIREKAYYIWVAKGCPGNTSMDDWLEAERTLSIR